MAILNDVEDRKSISFLYDLISLGMNRPDPKDGFGNFGGNHILIASNGIYVLLCHLKKGSITVHKGDHITIGQPIAQVGNSGSSIQPHLHLQVMEDENIFPLFENLIPFRISKGESKHEGRWLKKENFMLHDRGYYKF